jgi:hypothetical protein
MVKALSSSSNTAQKITCNFTLPTYSFYAELEINHVLPLEMISVMVLNVCRII